MLLGMLGFGLLWVAEVPRTVVELWWDRRHRRQPWQLLARDPRRLAVARVRVRAALRRARDRHGLRASGRRWWWLLAVPVFVGLIALDVFVAPWLQPTHPVARPGARGDRSRSSSDASTRRARAGADPDVSSQTSLPNAETEGIGPSKRVVIWDTLLDGPLLGGRGAGRDRARARSREAQPILKSVALVRALRLPVRVHRQPGRATARRDGGARRRAAGDLRLRRAAAARAPGAEPDHAAHGVRGRLDRAADDAGSGRRDALFESFVPTTLSDPNPPTWEYLLFENHPTIDQRIAMVRAWQSLRRLRRRGRPRPTRSRRAPSSGRRARAARRGCPARRRRRARGRRSGRRPRMVERRCAITKAVRPRRSRRSACSILRSVAMSTELVASSRIRMRGSARSARAKATSWRWPSERRNPRSPSWVS